MLLGIQVMNKNIFESLIGGCIVLFTGVLVFYIVMRDVNKSCYPIVAYFNDISGIVIGSNITVSGIKVGKISFMEFDDVSKSAKVSMCIQEGMQIPNDSSAVISSVNLMGEKNIKIQFGFSETFLHVGEEISYTQSALSIESLINRFIFKN